MKSKKILALIVSTTMFLAPINTLTFAKNKNLNLHTIALQENIEEQNKLENNIIQVNDLTGYPSNIWQKFTRLETGLFKIGFNEKNKKLKVFDIQSNFFSTLTHKRPYFILKVLDANWNVKKEITFKGDDITGWGMENEINNFQYNYGDILSLWISIPKGIHIYGKVLGLPEDYPYIRPDETTSYNFQITKEGLKAVHNLYNNEVESLNSNIIDIRSEFWKLSKYMKWQVLSTNGFKIKFDENLKEFKVIDRNDEYYLNKSLGYNTYFKFLLLDKNKKEKFSLNLSGYDTGKSNSLDTLNNLKYEYGDLIKVWCNSPLNEMISGKVLNATTDYSKGVKSAEILEETYFEITPKGLKEIKNKAPEILGVTDVVLKKGDSFNYMDNVKAIDDFDGDITKNLKVFGEVNTNVLGTYNLTYEIADSKNKITNLTRKVTVIEKPKIEENIIQVTNTLNYDLFNIGFDDLTKEFKVTNYAKEYLGLYLENPNYFSIRIFDKNHREKFHINLAGDDFQSHQKLDTLNNFKFQYGDFIALNQPNHKNLKIYGNIINELEDYSDGVDFIVNLENVYFQITKDGLKSFYNMPPVINGVKDKILKVGHTFNPLENITVVDDFDNDLPINITGTVNNNKAGIYNLIYTAKDSLGRSSSQKSKITVRELTPLEKNNLIVEGYDKRELLNIGFDTDNKKFILSRFNKASYFHGAFNDFFKINIKTKDGKEKLSLTIKGTDFPTSDKVNVLENFNFEYGDTLTLWHASTNDIDGKIKITGNVLDNKENYSDRLSLDAMNNTLFQLTHNGLKALYNESPIISGIEDVTLKVGESFDPLEGVSVSDDFDNNLIPTITGTVTPNVAGTYTLTYAIKDSGGREVLSTRNITVETNEKPIFTSIDDIEIKAGTSFNNLLGVKATDKEDGDLSKSIIVKGNVDINTPGIYELNYFVEDKDGNSLNEIRLINVKSNTKPVLEGVDNLTIKVNDIFEPLQGITATDMEDFDLNNSINIVGKVDTSKIGIYDLIYSVKDSDNNETVKTRRITVRSNEKPVIDGASNEVLKVHDSFNPLKGIIAIDKEDGDLIKNITIKGMVNTSKEGVYTLTYSIKDSDDNVAIVNRIIKVNSNFKPKLLGVEDITITLGESLNPYSFVSAYDKEEGDISHRIKIKGILNTNKIGKYELIYSVPDLDENETIEKRVITVRSNNPPKIIGSKLVTLKVGDKFDPLEGIIVTDVEDDNLIKSLVVEGEVKTNIPNEYHLTYSIEDSDGNKQVFKRNIIVKTNDKPVISGANDITVKAGEYIDLYHGVNAHDTEDGDLTGNLVVSGKVDTLKLGEYSISYFVKDKDGNTCEKTRKITVKSNEKPVLYGVDPITIKIGDMFNANLGVTAFDKEDGELTSKINIFGNVDTAKEGVTTLIYSIEDTDRNITTIRRRIKVRSNHKPVIIGADRLTIKEGDVFENLKGIIATDGEDGIITNNIIVTGNIDTSKIGEYALIYSITDSDGNITSMERNIIVKSNKKPIINGADSKIIKVGDAFNALDGITSTDFEDKDLTNKILVTGDINTNIKGNYKLIYSVTDSDNNTITTERIITVRSNNKPEIFGVEDTTIKAGENFESTSLAILAMDEEDGDLTKSVSITGSVNNKVSGEYKLIYSVIDSDGNKTSKERKITVKSNEKPVLYGVDPITLKIGDMFNANLGVTAFDKEDGELTSKINISGDVDSSKEGVSTLIYSVEDIDGNITTIRRRIKVRSNHKPKIIGTNTLTIKEGTTFEPLKDIIAIDGEDGIITNNVSITGTVDTSKIGEYALVYSITDSDKNITSIDRTIIVESNKKPIITGTSSKIIKIGDAFNALDGVTSMDFEDSDLTNKILVSGAINTNLKGNYKLIYSVTDSDNNTTSIERIITVRSNSKPEIFGVEDTIIKAGENFENTSLAILAMDEEDGDLTKSVSITGNVNNNVSGEYKLIYSVIDSDGNKTSKERIITVKSNEKPILRGVDATTVKVGDNFNAKLGVTAFDKEDGELTSKINISGNVDTTKEGVNTLIYSIEDTDGNITTVRRRIKVRSNHKPVIIGADKLTIKEGDVFENLKGIIATDAEDGIITNNVSITGKVDTSNVGEYALVYSITDSDGNITSMERNIIVKSNKKPMIIGAENKVIKIRDTFNPLEGVRANDFEDKNLTNEILVKGIVNNNLKGNYKLTYSVIDSDNNTTTIERIITVRSNSKPEIFGVEDTVIKAGENFESTSVAILAMDEEDGDLTKSVSIKGTVDPNTPGEYTLIYSVKDNDNNETIKKRKITVKSNNKPVINGVNDYVLKVGDIFNPLDNITALDKEDGDLTNKINVTGTVNTLKEGNYEITYSVMDSDNNKTFQNSLITVLSNEKPKLLNVEDTIIKQGESFNAYNEGVMALDKEDGDLTNKLTVEGIVNTSTIGEYIIVYSVKDSDNNITKSNKKVIVRSNTDPIIEIPYETTIKVGEIFDSLLNVIAKDKEDGDLISKIKIEGNVNTNKPGIYILKYHLQDSDGNTSSKTREIRVRSNDKPIINGADDVSIKIGDYFNPYLNVDVIDTEDGNLKNILEITGLLDKDLPGEYTLFYKVKDSDNNTVTLKRIITVNSNEKPIINGVSNLILNINEPFNPLKDITALDKEEGDLTKNIQVIGKVDTTKSGTYNLIYKISDKDNNITRALRKIIVKSNEKPKILGVKDLIINQYSRFNPIIGIRAKDKEDGNLTKLIKVNGLVDTSNVGDYTITYSVNDKDGNETIATRKITVISNEKPVIKELNKLVLKKGEIFDATFGIKAIDKEDGDISYLLKVTGKVNTEKFGLYTVNYSVIDSNENKTTFTRKILVKSDERPKILGVENITLNIGDSFNALEEIIARDEEDGDLTKKITIEGSVDTSKAGDYNLIYSIIDSDGNKTTSKRNITVKEINNIEIFGIENIEIPFGSTFDALYGITAKDSNNKDLTSSIVVKGSVDTSKVGVYDLSYIIKNNDEEEIRYFRQIKVKAKEEILTNLPHTPINTKEFLEEKIPEKINFTMKKQYKNFNTYINEPIMNTPENIEINETLPKIKDSSPKEKINNIESSKEKEKIQSIKIQELPPYEKKPIPILLIGAILIILGKKLRKKEE